MRLQAIVLLAVGMGTPVHGAADATGPDGQSILSDACALERVGPMVLELMANQPERVEAVYQSCETAVIQRLSNVLPDPEPDHVRAVAYSARPYGNSRSLTIRGLFTDAGLDCDNYNVLASLIYQQLGGDTPWRLLGFYGGAMGNHSVGFLDHDRPLILDPTLGFVSVGDFDALASGEIMPLEDFGWRDELHAYRSKIRRALETGATRPTDLMYWFPSVDVYIENPNSSRWIGTPGSYYRSESLRN